MFGRQYSQQMLDDSEPVELISEAALALVSGDPAKVSGGIRYTDDVVKEFGLTATDIGMQSPQPN